MLENMPVRRISNLVVDQYLFIVDCKLEFSIDNERRFWIFAVFEFHNSASLKIGIVGQFKGCEGVVSIWTLSQQGFRCIIWFPRDAFHIFNPFQALILIVAIWFNRKNQGAFGRRLNTCVKSFLNSFPVTHLSVNKYASGTKSVRRTFWANRFLGLDI